MNCVNSSCKLTELSRLIGGIYEEVMVFFAIVMLLAAYSMIKGRKESDEAEKKPLNIGLF